LIPAAAFRRETTAQGSEGEQDDRRNVKPVATASGGDPWFLRLYDDSKALLIGVSKYDNFSRLPGVEEDMAEVEKVLRRSGFDVEILPNPGRDEMDMAILSFIERWGVKKEHLNNRLLIYFAGHAVTLYENENQLGYLVPSDAAPDSNKVAFRNTAISMNRFKEYVKPIKAKHVLFVFDSCFSGYMFEAMRSPHPAPDVPPAIVQEKVSLPARQFITAGTDKQQVPDKSVFRREFVEALNGQADYDGDRYITGTELCYFLEARVAKASERRQRPLCGRSDPENGGDFVFAVSSTNNKTWPLSSQYVPSGWMGDGGGDAGPKFLSIAKEVGTIGGESRAGVKIEYKKGPKGWAGIYWQHPNGNWGDKEGYDLSDAKAIAFYAKGELGGEIVEFISGGIQAENKPHRDSFKKSLGEQVLTREWKQYTIDLMDVDPEKRKHVIGAFAWVGSGGFDGSGKMVCHIADIQVVVR
jgi:hypothetical protein